MFFCVLCGLHAVWWLLCDETRRATAPAKGQLMCSEQKACTALEQHVSFQVVSIAKVAVDRLSAKLAAVKGTGRPVDMAEEFRMLTLQVIGEAILSLPPEECDKARLPAGHMLPHTGRPAWGYARSNRYERNLALGRAAFRW